MATNNYFGFTHGGTQYSATATGAAYQAGQAGYAVAAPATAAAAATYGTQRAAAGYDTAYQAAAASQGTYAAVGTGATPAYEYGYGQTAAASYSGGYDQTAAAAAKSATYAQTYTQRAAGQQQAQAATAAAKPAQYTGTYQANATGYQATYAQPAAQTTIAAQPTTQAKRYDAALYSAATMYVAQQSGGAQQQKTGGWQGYKKGGIGAKNMRTKAPPKPQQLHYCDVCKISCAGPQTYREHLEGQKHKKREAATKMAASVAVTNQNRAGNSLRCQLCDVTCTGNDAYAAHIRGAKHQKVVLLHTKLGKPIPPQEPEIIGGARKSVSSQPKINFVQSGGLGIPAGNGDSKDDDVDDTPEPDIQPVGQDYIEEIKSEDGKVISFNCKLCECRFNDPNAKEMHMKGRRHRLQYKKKVNPDLVVDVKPSLRQRKIQEEKMRRAALREEFWARRHYNMPEDEEDRMYWEDRRRYEEEYMEMVRRGNIGPYPRGRPFPGGAPPGGMPLARRTESSDDRHVMARHSEIYPKEEELQSIQRIVSHTERALKMVSDQLAEAKPKDIITTSTTSSTTTTNQTTTAPTTATTTTNSTTTAVTTNNGTVTSNIKQENTTTQPIKTETEKSDQPKEDGRDNQLFSFQQDRDANRILKGVMRVGHLAKGLLLRGDANVELVVLCADKPTLTLLRKVVDLLPGCLKLVTNDNTTAYTVQINAAEAGLTVSGDGLTVLVQLTSPIMREQEAASGGLDRDVLSRGKCLQALAALRHTKWFQARALGLHSCVVIIRILRDLCQRVPTWSPLSSWAMELLAEKVISSVPGQVQLSPGDALRRVMEAVASGLLLPGGPGLGDPCEKDSPDAAIALTAQQREDLTCSAQYALRLIAYRQIYKVLGMDPLPTQQKVFRRDRSARKRRRSGGEQADSNVKIFDIKNCPIPSSSFADLLSDYFNITQLEFLFVTAPSTNNFILTKEHFANLSTIKILTFNSPFLSYENNFLEYLPNITRLYLNNNNFQNVNINFNYTPSLVYLDLSRNKLDNLNSNWFYGLENLKILHLFGNRFMELNRDMFSGLNALQSLELSNNKIKFIKEDTFYDLIKLKNLSLLTNQLEFLPRNLLKNNQQLEGVRLGFNPKLRLDDYLLANLTNLKTVTLSYSNLETIPEHLFNGDENLIEILLDHNKLETLPVGVFSALKKLTLLSLNKNQIKHLPDEVFNSLSKLEKLDLSNNLLTNITANLFTSLINLKYLLLERNAINFIDINAFKELRNVIYLNLAHNQYTMDDYPAELHPFTSLLNIEELDLSYNMITTVNSNMIFLYPNIKRLNLSHNYVDSLAVETICPSSKYVLTLDLSYNNISWFDMKNFDVILPEYGKTILNLTNNPFNCDCFNYHFLRYLQQDQIKTIEIVQSNMFKCNLPKQLENNHFKTLKLSSLLCELNTNYKGCPETCKCYLKTFDKALIIDCAYKNLTKLPKFKVQSFTNQTVLNLIGNFIENIPEFTENLKEYKNVTVLYLNDNRLKDLAWLPPNLTEVHLDGNKLSHLRNNIITEMKNSTTLQTVTLKNNPWTCDCSNFHFQRFLQFNPKVDANKIFCANTTDLVHHIKDICPSYLIIYLTIGFATVLFFVILIALYYRYEQEIKVWLYAKNILLWLVTEEELDKDKQFDVFVSYSHKDEKFVVEKLMPELESGPNPYSVCVHYRNWVPGEFIATQLTNSVLNSRRTLVVLSNNFVDSIWGKMEFRTAHMEAIREGRARVIVLIYGDLNEDMLDEELKVYLKTNTYVKWGDPYFWNKLKYALPHRKLMKNQQKLQNIMLKIDDKFELNENPVNCANKLQTPPAEA